MNVSYLILIGPLVDIDHESHDDIIGRAVSHSFGISAAGESDLRVAADACHGADYIPSYELGVGWNDLGSVVKITVHFAVMCAGVVVMYQTVLAATPSMYVNERANVIYRCMRIILCVYTSTVLTNATWLPLHLNRTLHRYDEFNFYEFEVSFDMRELVNDYLFATYLHIYIMWFVNGPFNVTVASFLATRTFCGGPDLLYYIALIFARYTAYRVWKI